jgi:hypothetical protein
VVQINVEIAPMLLRVFVIAVVLEGLNRKAGKENQVEIREVRANDTLIRRRDLPVIPTTGGIHAER